jgi:hypothetical protein
MHTIEQKYLSSIEVRETTRAETIAISQGADIIYIEKDSVEELIKQLTSIAK